LRCYAELIDHLPPARRQREQVVRLRPPVTLADLLETQGISPTLIDLALVNGCPCALDKPLGDGDRVSLYPVFEALDLTPVRRPRLRPLRRPRFVADAHLGGLARYLRLLGFDTRFENDPGDDALAEISATEHRVLLSRDLGLLARRRVTHGLWVPGTRPRAQLAWVVERLDLYRLSRPFTRCMPCNGTLEPVTRERVRDLIPERVLADFERFWCCRGCGRVYWRGSHYQRLRAFVDRLVGPGQPSSGVVCGQSDGLSCRAKDRKRPGSGIP
jgi:uncharacterized protein with PIN domain